MPNITINHVITSTNTVSSKELHTDRKPGSKTAKRQIRTLKDTT